VSNMPYPTWRLFAEIPIGSIFTYTQRIGASSFTSTYIKTGYYTATKVEDETRFTSIMQVNVLFQPEEK
jgi:hypothetical protein